MLNLKSTPDELDKEGAILFDAYIKSDHSMDIDSFVLKHASENFKSFWNITIEEDKENERKGIHAL